MNTRSETKEILSKLISILKRRPSELVEGEACLKESLPNEAAKIKSYISKLL